MTMVGSTARPGVRRGDVSEEPRRWLLVAVLVASLVSTTRAGCSANGPGVDCVVYGNSQVQSFCRTVLYDFIRISVAEQKSGGGSERLIIQTEAFKNINAKYIEFAFISSITCQPRAFSCDGAELKALKMYGNAMLSIADGAFDGLAQLTYVDLSDNRLKTVIHQFANTCHVFR